MGWSMNNCKLRWNIFRMNMAANYYNQTNYLASNGANFVINHRIIIIQIVMISTSQAGSYYTLNCPICL